MTHKQRIIEHISTFGPSTSRDLVNALGISINQASNLLNDLHRSGKVEIVGAQGHPGKGRPNRVYKVIPPPPPPEEEKPRDFRQLQTLATMQGAPLVQTRRGDVYHLNQYRPTMDGSIKYVAWPQ